MRQPALVFHPDGDRLSEWLQMVDDAGQWLAVALHYDLDAWGDATVTVSPYCVVHNTTGLDLVYAHEDRDVYGQPVPRLAAGQLTLAQAATASPSPFVLGCPSETEAGGGPGRIYIASATGGDWSAALALDSDAPTSSVILLKMPVPDGPPATDHYEKPAFRLPCSDQVFPSLILLLPSASCSAIGRVACVSLGGWPGSLGVPV